ncbi:TIGR04211 family SH3 domain-containing protein [Oceanobacter sp. 5_MG-2023]|uniref:TIGR04211 family SH3 domain-containing protein n=1 Tax=Oceanobacter sp. 5_MG-2023 TaxID=3062645 RepID=UPI0026E2EE29|nr:TIGR04211 family SH3 domain-containing protein [Oceanobacter sp. 5_MG-2023]MDO6683005.1 TIGR04211 family SH3 domain-containing protein [Oceanobacter sp. 5_MG-2023]
MKLLTQLGLCLIISAGTTATSGAQAEQTAAGDSYVAVSAGSKRYVTDTLWLQLRSGPSAQHRIIQALKSGEHLTLIGENTDAGYSLVRTSKNNEGWVLTRYLDNQPTAREHLVVVNQELERTKAELTTATERLQALETEVKGLRSERSDLEQKTVQVTQELNNIREVSSGALALDEKARKLSTRNQELEIQLEAISVENAQLREDRDLNRLIYGGGLVFLGILAGLILPSLRGGRKHTSSWS